MRLADTTPAYSQHALPKSIFLHILPGAVVTLALFLLKPIVDQVNYPPLMAFLFATLFIDFPIMWAIMLAAFCVFLSIVITVPL